MTGDEPSVPPTGWGQSLVIFGISAALLFSATRVWIPALSDATGVEPVVSWFVIGGAAVFLPVALIGYLLLRSEGSRSGRQSLAARLRLRRMRRADWLWGVGALLVIGLLTMGVQKGLGVLGAAPDLHPPFMAFEPLSPGRYWILLAWLPFWVLNILAEEVVWRGAVLPRQERALGAHAWLANATGWLLFHLAFGWHLMLVLAPIILILPYVTQRRENTWVAVLIHAGVNGPGFVAVALGLV